MPAPLDTLSGSTANALRDPLRTLRDRFDARLAALDTPNAGNQLRDLMNTPGTLDDNVKAGKPY